MFTNATPGRPAALASMTENETPPTSSPRAPEWSSAYPKRPATVRAFVDTLDFQGPTGTMEIVFVQRGRSLAKLIVVGINAPSRPLALALEQTLAARLR